MTLTGSPTKTTSHRQRPGPRGDAELDPAHCPRRRLGAGGTAAAGHRNRVTHWWDGSQVYGSDTDTIQHLRTGEGGKLRIGPGGRIPRNPETGRPEAGFTDNWWLGLDLMHSAWVLEHNAVCDHLAGHFPQWNDQALFDRARLVVSALMAKIHTVEWTTAILGHPALQVAMNANWWGLQGERGATGSTVGSGAS